MWIVNVSTWDSVFSRTDCPSSDWTSVFTSLCSLVGGWPGRESGSCMKNSSSPLLRLHLCIRSGRTSGSGRGGGLKAASDFFISISSGSCLTEKKIMCIFREQLCAQPAFMILYFLLSWATRYSKNNKVLQLPSIAESMGSQSSSTFSILRAALLNSSLNPHPDTARGSWTGQLLCSLLRKGSSINWSHFGGRES